MKKYIIIAILLCCSPAYSQLSNFLNKTVDGIATVRDNSTLLDSLFFTSTYSQAVFDIIAHIQKVGQNIDNYTSVASAKTAAKANSGMLVVPRKSSLFQDSTVTAAASDSIVIFDFRDGKLVMSGTTSGFGGDFSDGGESNGANRTLGNNDNFDLGFETNGSTRMTIQGDGDIGIGTVSPSVAFHHVSTGNQTIRFESRQDGTLGPEIDLFLNSGTPADDDDIGTILFLGDDDAATQTTYAKILAESQDVTNNDEAGSIDFRPNMNAVERSFLMLNGFNGTVDQGEIIFNEDGQDVDTRIEASGAVNAFFVQGSDGFVGIGTASPSVSYHHVSTTNQTIRYESTSAGTLGPELDLFHNSASPADNDELGRILFLGDDDASTQTPFVALIALAQDVTNNDEAGSFDFDVTMNSIARSFLMLDGFNGTVDQGEIIFNEDSQDIDFRIENNNDVNAFFIDGANTALRIGMGTGSPLRMLHLLNSESSPEIRIEGTNADAFAVGLSLFHNSSSPADDDELGRIIILGDDSGGGATAFADITVYSSDVTDTDEAGQITMHVVMNATLRNIFDINGFSGIVDQGEIIFNEDGQDVDIRMEASGVVNAYYIEGSTGNIGIGTGSPLGKLHLDAAGGTDGTGTRWENGSAATTDATLTTIFTLATVTDRDYLIEASYVASETDGTNEYYAKIFFAVSNVGGTVTEDAETDDFEQDNSAASAADASGAVSGTNYLIQWTGVAAETWNCEVSLKITVVAH